MNPTPHPAGWQQPPLPDFEPFDDDDPDETLVWVIDGDEEYLGEVIPLFPDPTATHDEGATP